VFFGAITAAPPLKAGDLVLQVLADLPYDYSSEVTLTESRDGSLYGTVEQGGINGAGAILRLVPNGELSDVFTFGYTNGYGVNGPLVETGDGYLYGTTRLGGAHQGGTIFRMSSDGSVAILHSFDIAEGAFPHAGLVQGNDGALYGTTSEGGRLFQGFYRYGSVFRMDLNGVFRDLYFFQRERNGFGSQEALEPGQRGLMYGVTYAGGANGYGTIFRVKLNGAFTTLYSFTPDDGSPPNSLTEGTDGYLYGTTSDGGEGGFGTAFKLSPQQGKVTRLVSFRGTNGFSPSRLVLGEDGLPYGTAGVFGGYGIIFRLASDGTMTTCYIFAPVEGFPRGPLYRGRRGALYGTTVFGGKNGYGIVYRLSLASPFRTD